MIADVEGRLQFEEDKAGTESSVPDLPLATYRSLWVLEPNIENASGQAASACLGSV